MFWLKVGAGGEEEASLYQHGSSHWSNHQVDKRQMNKGKSPNSAHAYVWGLTYTGESETPRAGEAHRQNGNSGGHTPLSEVSMS